MDQQTDLRKQQIKLIKKKRRRGCLISVLIVLAVFLTLVIVLANTVGKSTSTASKQSLLAKTMELTEEQESAVVSIFESCGIQEISSVEVFQVGEEHTSYYVNDVETAAYSGANSTIVVWVGNDDKTVEEIYYHDVTIYADGEVKAQLPDYYISEAARDTYRVSTQLLVNNCLSYPDTAEYPTSHSKWTFAVSDGYDAVQSTVTAKNAYGVTNTMKFTVKYDRNTGEAVSLILDGKEYIN
jgi:hypothetical protein